MLYFLVRDLEARGLAKPDLREDLMAANPHYAEGEVIANKYVVEGLIGESPAARTFLTTGSVGKLAVKIYRPEVSARLLAAPDFFLKAFVVTEIEHDNLCGCIDVQEEMGLVFVARAFNEGQSFEDWIRSHRTAGNYYSRGMELLWQTCQGLNALHERTRHLDIHPGNVIVGPIVAKLCDWDPRALGNMEMTPDILPVRSEYQGYRAPEAAGQGGFLSYPSTDLFAVAGMLYRLIKGEHPSVNPAQTLGEIRSFEKDVAVFLTKAMHPKPEERFQDASAFSDGLWELQGAMQRMQERGVRVGTQSTPKPVPQPAPPKDDFMFPDPPVASPHNGFADIPAGKEPAFSGAPAAAPENDSFFNFFPPADAAPATGNPDQARKVPQPSELKSSGDTLFGAPSFQAPHNESTKPKWENPAYVPPRQESRYTPPAPSGGLSDLETPGTLFGAQAPLFS
ncbi:MAG: hypothetical protein M3Y08_08385, partial [Fibrobacterota bacterium]|nr:hypothetical protein [Fibrobacterota bacterium]